MPEFAAPYLLLALPLPLLAWLLPPARRAEIGALYMPPAIAERLPSGAALSVIGALPRILAALIWLLLVVALAGPRLLTTTDALPVSGRDIVLVLDLSGSMSKTDFDLGGQAISRLDAVKEVATRFVEGREGDRVGLVLFAEKAYFASPLTYDVKALAQAIDEATIGISGQSTAIADGLGLALKRLQTSDAKSRVIILLSDGADTAGAVIPAEVGTLARKLGVTVDTIALGPKDLETSPDARDAVDSATLKAIADASGGTSFRVRTLDDLQGVATSIDALEPSIGNEPPVTVYRDLWIYPAGAALLLALVLLLFRGERG
ncbi:VWFA-related Acidobacterial domain protein [Hartmannibacter diazotrophicus]|uniref:VWFA-related Acidobacterial domain protein n=1 Tax=Hartmannibacter diazotrophicus TaxID=1482074 RepID=A0A2C9D4Z6_9HYPH|nr:VWA domain-containing protein [Hartmannibacter diazotrophicus]SON54575.1 VWFA-related Acidobacterial domain protein [Hartmannibacter diazotrophicus]